MVHTQFFCISISIAFYLVAINISSIGISASLLSMINDFVSSY